MQSRLNSGLLYYISIDFRELPLGRAGQYLNTVFKYIYCIYTLYLKTFFNLYLITVFKYFSKYFPSYSIKCKQ